MPELHEPKSLTRFENKTFTVKHAGMTAEVEGLSGWRWAACAEVEFDAASARRYAAFSHVTAARTHRWTPPLLCAGVRIPIWTLCLRYPRAGAGRAL
jgi:hypothetical protein